MGRTLAPRDAPIVAGAYPPGVRRPAVLLLLISSLAFGCGRPDPSFDPTGPCDMDGRVPGAYPALEAMIPAEIEGQPPTRLDSGRSCSDAALGTLVAGGIDDLRFAGGLWETGERSGYTLAVFSAPGLTDELLFEFYEAGANAARRTETVTTGIETGRGHPLYTLDTLNGESFQSIYHRATDEPGLIRVALVGTDVRENQDRTGHDATLALLRELFLDR